ncbi:hypothetical protein [Ensifer aridi]|uniref:hypothetical protein n=1 Tax=Ensifer aridi TaxID=1708715 RepID=UPI001FD89D6F|nr:hypothetical protein [Ensifer aridi]
MFQSHNPVRDSAGWPDPGYTDILDFDPTEDTFAFDAVGYYSDGTSANFINHASSRPGHPVDTFHSGAASDANGEDVVVVTDKSFHSGDGAANAIAGETTGDIIVYHDDLTKSAVLAYVTSENHADEFAHLGSVHSLADLAGSARVGGTSPSSDPQSPYGIAPRRPAGRFPPSYLPWPPSDGAEHYRSALGPNHHLVIAGW